MALYRALHCLTGSAASGRVDVDTEEPRLNGRRKARRSHLRSEAINKLGEENPISTRRIKPAPLNHRRVTFV